MAGILPLGVYAYNPDGNNPTAEAQFESSVNQMASIIGQAPQFIDAFADFSSGWSAMVPSAQWSAWSQKQSPVAKSLTPIVAVPLATHQDYGTATLQAVAAGAHDSVYSGVAAAYRDAGFSTVDIRVGWEMDGDYMPWSMGTTSQSAAIWKAAFSHVADVLHSVQGIKVNVIWNPAMSNNNQVDVRETYPGDDKVDIVGLDLYSHNYKADQSISDYQYFMYPGATAANPTGNPVSEWGLAQTMAFAAAHNKTVGIAETGVAVGDTTSLPGVIAAAFAAPGAPQAAFVTVWDVTTPEGDWKFTDGNNPGAASAWAAAFAQARATAPSAPAAAAATAPSGSLVVQVSEDAWQGDAQFTVSVDGVQQGGTYTTTASHAAGATQSFAFAGNWTGSHNVSVNFLNDAWGGSPSTDRNLYVNSISLNGVANPGTSAVLGNNGARSFAVSDAAASGGLVLHLSEDAYQGDAQYTVAVDGVQIGGVQTVTASHGAGATQDVKVGATLSSGSHSVTVNFLNDGWGGNPSLDRNMYVDSIDFNGVSNLGARATLGMSGPQTMWVTDSVANATTAAIDQTVVANLSEDAYQGNAQFLITLDGKALNGATEVSTLHSSGFSQAFAYSGQFGVGPHDLAISFLNDGWGGTASTDRNLYVNSIDFNGHHYAADTAALMTNGTQHFQVGVAGQL